MSGARQLCAMRACPASIEPGEHLCAAHLVEFADVIAYAWAGFSSNDPVRALPPYPLARPVADFLDALWIALARLRPGNPDRGDILDFIAACNLAARLPDLIGESWLAWLRLQRRRQNLLGGVMLYLKHRVEWAE